MNNNKFKYLSQINRLVSSIDKKKWMIASEERRNYIATFVNPLTCNLLGKNFEYLATLEQFDDVFIDGMLLNKAIQSISDRPIQRISFDGNSLAAEVFEYCNQHNLSLCLLGGKQGVAELAGKVISNAYPGITISKTYPGYFENKQAIEDCQQEILQVRPDFIVVGMGAPNQDYFLLKLRESGFDGIGFTCGGYLDQLGEGNVAYYPGWIEKYNLRSVYRLMKEPRRIGKRYIIDYFDFYKEFILMKIYRLSAINKKASHE